MSAILDSVLDPERRAQCFANDERLARGEPIRHPEPEGMPQARATLSKATVFHARAAVVKMCACCLVLGFAAGQLVVDTNRPARAPVQIDKNDVHKVPSTVPARVHQRVVV